MKRVLASSLVLIAGVACGYAHVMQPIVFERGGRVSRGELSFPRVFQGDSRFEDAATNCAQLYNGSVGENQECTKYSDWLGRGEAVSILTTTVATGIASTVGNDRARQHYTAVALSATAVTGALVVFDNLLNCRTRAVAEFNNAKARLETLERAAHLLECVKRLEKADAAPPASGEIGCTDSSEDLVCGRLVDGKFRLRDIDELREQVGAELRRCILIGAPTGYGEVPSPGPAPR